MVSHRLAIYGGNPVRTQPMPTGRLGGSLYGKEELQELADVVAEQSPFRHYGIGIPRKAAQVEEKTKAMLGSRFTLALSSGSAALVCAIAACGVGPGDEVILPSFGWYSNYGSIVMSGALPVFADIDDSFGIDPQDFERKITSRTKAVVVIHFQGGAARIEEIAAIARSRGITVIEDCAQAFGGLYKSKPLGTHGDIGIASFQFNKVITSGEGGLLFTDDETYFARAVRYHDLGLLRPYFLDQLTDKSLGDPSHAFPGNQYRLSELQAAVLVAQLDKLPSLLDTCRKLYARLHAKLSGVHFRTRPTDPGHCGITYFMYFQTKEEADKFAKALAAEGIPCGPSSGCTNLMELPSVRDKTMAFRDMPPFGAGWQGEYVDYASDPTSARSAERVAKTVAVPIGPCYTAAEIDDIANAIRKVDAVFGDGKEVGERSYNEQDGAG